MLGNNTNWVKAYIVDVLPCISIAFFTFAYIYNDAYYTVFEIDIAPYASFGDIFMSITTPLIIFAILAAFVLAFVIDTYTTATKALENFEEDLKKNPKPYIPFEIKYLLFRYFVKLKQTKVFQYLKNKKIISNKKKVPVTRETHSSLMIELLFSFIVYAFSGSIYSNYVEEGVIIPSLLSSSIALMIPLLVVPMLLYAERLVGASLLRKKWVKASDFSNYRIVAIIIGFYVYGVIMFNIIGHKGGIQAMINKPIKFEIVTTNGEHFDNTKYIYIGHISNNTFLREAKKNINIILNEECIVTTYIEASKFNSFTSELMHTYNLLKKFEKEHILK